ncbi:hypothetical protein AOQ84DRAFT_133346 [Glonium stellatum]|uniref:Uncharacterized protein n=1 Tax=Glonium stellatum TaxID=574774 RepID=A0A8E2JNR9_9PEZI|nr:hypothetical protein AOQ84DRAFT_133346 [Glonium stellatum]
MPPKNSNGASKGKGKAKKAPENSKGGDVLPSEGAAAGLKSKRHRVGTAHQVKEEDRTGTKWDAESYETLRRQCRERGLLHKNLKKAQLAKQLAEDDSRNSAAAVAKRQRDRQQRIQDETQKRRKASEKSGRAALREQRREGENESEEGHFVSSYDGGIVGELATPSDTAITTETTTRSSLQSSYHPNIPYQTLCIFEWPYPELPSPRPPKTPTTPHYNPEYPMDLIGSTPRIHPVRMKYKPMFLQTTKSNEGVVLPGKKSPPNLAPDFVPKPSPEAVEAVRNGVRIKQLRRTKIESGEDWNKRTQLQWWDGSIFLEDFQTPGEWGDGRTPSLKAQTQNATKASSSPSRSTSKPTPAPGVGSGSKKPQSKPKPAEGRKNQGRNRKQLALEATTSTIKSRHPVLYVPAHLDLDDDVEYPHTLDRLFYITYLDQEMPHFFFWTRPGEWEDPRQENPKYSLWKAQDQEDARIEQDILDVQRIQRETYNAWGRAEDLKSNILWYQAVPLSSTRIRVKKPRATLNPLSTDLKDYSGFKDPELERAICMAEELLIKKGLKYTLEALRDRYDADEGDHENWGRLTESLPRLYPAGKLPEAPPVHLKEIPDESIALKIAKLEYGRPPLPLRGDEPWTRNDDKYWDIVRKPPILDEKLEFLDDAARKRKRSTSSPGSEGLPRKRARFHESSYESKHHNSEQFLQRPFDDFNDHVNLLTRSKNPMAFLDTYAGKPSGISRTKATYASSRRPYQSIKARSTQRARAMRARRNSEPDWLYSTAGLSAKNSSLRRSFGSMDQGATNSICNPIKGKKAAGLGVKVSFAPNTVEKRTAYNDKIEAVDVAADGDLDTPIISTRLNLQRTAPAAKNPPKRRYHDPKVEVPILTGVRAKSSKVSKISTVNPRVSSSSTKSSRRKTRAVDPTYKDLPTPSSCTPSPVLRVPRRKPHNHPDATFRIRKASLAEASDDTSPLLKPKKKTPKAKPSSAKATPAPIHILSKKRKPGRAR